MHFIQVMLPVCSSMKADCSAAEPVFTAQNSVPVFFAYDVHSRYQIQKFKKYLSF